MNWNLIKSGVARRNPREKRLLLYLLVVGCFAAWKLIPRPWTPSHALQTLHYQIESTATQGQTEQLGQHLETLYRAYSNKFCNFPQFKRDHPPLKIRFHKDREEFRRIYPGLGWAEAFYKSLSPALTTPRR